MTVKILVTGFDPFDNEPINAAWEVVRSLADKHIEGVELTVTQIPTVFGDSVKAVKQAIDEVKPEIVVCVGQAGGRSALSFERVGINLDDARIPDNRGNQPVLQQNQSDGPAAYFSTLPVRRLVEGLKENGIPAEESLTAGTYVCNHVLYGLMHYLSTSGLEREGVIGGFIHIPFLPSQSTRHKNAPCLSHETMVEGLQYVIHELVRFKKILA